MHGVYLQNNAVSRREKKENPKDGAHSWEELYISMARPLRVIIIKSISHAGKPYVHSVLENLWMQEIVVMTSV